LDSFAQHSLFGVGVMRVICAVSDVMLLSILLCMHHWLQDHEGCQRSCVSYVSPSYIAVTSPWIFGMLRNIENLRPSVTYLT
jgi:hypothetical protein